MEEVSVQKWGYYSINNKLKVWMGCKCNLPLMFHSSLHYRFAFYHSIACCCFIISARFFRFLAHRLIFTYSAVLCHTNKTCSALLAVLPATLPVCCLVSFFYFAPTIVLFIPECWQTANECSTIVNLHNTPNFALK